MSRSAATTMNLSPAWFRAALDDIEPERRRVRVIWSTGADVMRMDPGGGTYLERLSMKSAHVRLGRLTAGAPVLDSHRGGSIHQVLGVVDEAWLADGQGFAWLRFSTSGRPEVDDVWLDISDKIVRNVSVGYRIYKLAESREQNMRVLSAVDWEPYEISIVPMGADAGAQVKRAGTDPAAVTCDVVSADADDLTPLSTEDADRMRHLRLARAYGLESVHHG